jgi:hypothetical protein
MATLKTGTAASAFAHAETRYHGDQQDQNQDENDYEFDRSETL